MQKKQESIFNLLRNYKLIIILLVLVTIIVNVLSIVVPKIIAKAIDNYSAGSFLINNLLIEFSVIAFFIFVFTYLQNIIQIYASEKVALDLRNDLTKKISEQPYAYVQEVTAAKLLTNLTSDVDAVKLFVSMAVSSIISSVVLIFGVAILLLLIDWKLGLLVLSVTPAIGLTFFFIFRKVRQLFKKVQEAIDWLNKVISESILGSALIRLLDSQEHEDKKFLSANFEAKRVSLEILKLFSALIPVVTFFTNLATLFIILLGGHFVISGEMSLGNFTAFNTYLAILIFPILILGFVSNIIAQSQASYARIAVILNMPNILHKYNKKLLIKGKIELKKVNVKFGEKFALKDISLVIKPKTKTAIIGPTAGGKTLLLYLLTGLLAPSSGEILFDNLNINDFDKESLHSQVGFVFQDSVMFNLSLRENIAFSNLAKDIDIEKAVETAELKDYINSLPNKLDTIISERGTSLSGGQKQRIMLARALVLNPKILLLDDFTSRVDASTELKILNNLAKNYSDLTLISITQKISDIKHYDQIILLMEGELLAKGTHKELMKTCAEYVQIYQSQRSTNQYEQ